MNKNNRLKRAVEELRDAAFVDTGIERLLTRAVNWLSIKLKGKL